MSRANTPCRLISSEQFPLRITEGPTPGLDHGENDRLCEGLSRTFTHSLGHRDGSEGHVQSPAAWRSLGSLVFKGQEAYPTLKPTVPDWATFVMPFQCYLLTSIFHGPAAPQSAACSQGRFLSHHTNGTSNPVTSSGEVVLS